MAKVEVKVDPSLSKDLVVGNKVFRSTFDFRVSARDLEKAQKELKETEVKRRTCLEELKTMLSKDKRIRYRMDDDYLLRYLRFRKYDVQKTYKFIQHFYTMRNEDPLLFSLPTDAQIECHLRGKFVTLLPYSNDDGEMVWIHRVGHWNNAEVSVRDFCIMFSYMSDVCSMNPHAQIDGAIDLFDFEDLSAGQLSELLYPSALRFWTKFLQEVYPWRVKKIIAFNVKPVLYASLYIIKCLLKKKIADRLVLVRSDLNELHQHINPEILPKHYGGKLEDEECSSYLKKVMFSNKEYLRYENSFIENKELSSKE